MRLYFGGAEIPTHRKWLEAAGIKDVYLSYIGLSRRVKFARPWIIDEKFPKSMNIMLDAGAYSVNKEGAEHDLDELAAIATGYESFVALNHERLDSFTEFDALPLGLDWIKARRDDFWHDYDSKFMPVWHSEYGLDELQSMAARYKRIGILQTSLGDRDLAPVLNMLAAKRGVLLHGLAMTKQDVMREVSWDSVGSTRWIAPMQYGDTFVWTGRELKSYPKAYKEQSRKRHRTLFTSNGFDAEKIALDDSAEVAKLSLWSWQQFLEDVNKHAKPKLSAVVVPFPVPPSYTTGEATPPVDNDPAATVQVQEPARARERQMLPGIGLEKPEGREGLELSVRGDNMRECNTCFMATRNCPGYEAGAQCLYEFPIVVRGAAQVKAVEDGLIEMQTQRVMFMRMIEDKEGGYADPNLSNEMDRLSRMIKNQRDGMAEKRTLFMQETNRPGELGLLNRMFGNEVAEAQQIEAVSVVDDMIRESEIVDAELVERPEK
jgi:hypothetical protein